LEDTRHILSVRGQLVSLWQAFGIFINPGIIFKSKKMSKIFLPMVFGMIALTSTLPAQQTSIKGQVSDAADNAPVFAASVILLKQDSTVIFGTSSDMDGVFELKNVPEGEYLLSTSCLGYETSCIPLFHGSDEPPVKILLKESAVSLQAVTVQARSVIHKADRTLILPSQEQVKTSTGGIDLLQKMQLPRIFIDPVSEEVSTTGNGEVQLRMNGIQVTNAEITALQPEDIMRIEYHDNPGARYGTAAVVIDYITRRRSESGGNLKILTGAHLDGKASDDRLSFQYNRGKSEFSTNAEYVYRNVESFRNYNERFIYSDHELHRVENGEPTQFIKHILNTTFNYSFTEKDRYFFNTRVRYNFYREPFSRTDRNSTLYLGNDPVPFSIYEHASETNHLPALDVYFQHNLKNNQLLIFNVVGTQIKSDYSRIYHETQADNVISELFSDISGNKYSVIVEGIYEKRTQTGIFTAGVKHTQAQTENLYRGMLNADVTMGQAESYAYAEYQLKRGKWGYMANLAGSRFYFSQTEKTTERFALLPSARITYNPNSNWNFRYRASLHHTIPSLAYLNNVEQQIDPLQIRRGNPYLKSFHTLSQNLNIDYYQKIFSLNLLLRYDYEFSPVMESVLFENGLFVRTYENQRNFQTLSVEPVIRLKPWKNYLSISVSPRLVHFISNGNHYSHTFDLATLNMNIDGAYKNWFVNFMAGAAPHLNYFYGEQSATCSMMNVLSAGYKQKNFSVMAGMINPFGLKFKMKSEHRAALNPVITDAWNDGMKQKITVRLTYNFNFGKQFQGVNRRMENKDENSGIMSGGKD